MNRNRLAMASSAKLVYEKAEASVVFIDAALPIHKRDCFGSGVVIGKNVVVTNHHVVEGAKSVKIKQSADAQASEEYTLDAEVVIGNEEWDISLLFVNGLSASPAPAIAALGAAESLGIGDDVYALGAPEGLRHSLTGGIVSQLRHEIPDHSAPIIQTDVAIAGGSSGGGLFNGNGELAGITTATRGESANIALAMPVELAAELLAKGSLESEKEYVAAAFACALRHHGDRGNARAQFDLGWLYENIGEGNVGAYSQFTDDERWFIRNMPEDDELFLRFTQMKAVEWYQRAAEQGHIAAQYRLAVLHDGVIEEEGDKTKVAEWYGKVVDAEDDYWSVLAMKPLGELLDKGEGGVVRNREKATNLFRQAAEGLPGLSWHGITQAQYYLAELYKEGEGIEQNAEEAYIWFFIAAEGGNESAAKERDKMEEVYNASEINDAKAEAKKRLEEINAE